MPTENATAIAAVLCVSVPSLAGVIITALLKLKRKEKPVKCADCPKGAFVDVVEDVTRLDERYGFLAKELGEIKSQLTSGFDRVYERLNQLTDRKAK